MTCFRIPGASLLLASACLAQSFVNYESPQVHPLRLSPSGRLLLALNTPDQRLSVYSLANARKPALLREIQVGLEPVSLCPRTEDEVWIVNHLSDSISIVSISAGQVIATIPVKDEPADVVFAGKPEKAFVSVAASKEVRVFDPAARKLLATIPILGEEPRALLASPDGSKVWLCVHRSGNRTTVIPDNIAPQPPKPPKLPTPPRQSMLVSSEDPTWKPILKVDLPDQDVWQIDSSTFKVTRTWQGVGTILFGMAQRPGTSELWVANTEALNLVRFEPNLRGHFIDSRVTRIDARGLGKPTHFDLNTGIDYKTLPNPKALARALSQPTDLVFDPKGQRLYVAAFGTDRIGVLDSLGRIVGLIEVGNTPGTRVDSRNKRGPRGLAHHPSQAYLYCLNRLRNSISVIDTRRLVTLGAIAMPDPTPKWLKEARGFLYDAKLSGNGTNACASCHVDGDIDGLAWDLGDPGGQMSKAKDPFSGKLFDMHPMKGPMTTQTLEGLARLAPYHWRGDKARLEDFNPAFDELMGGKQLSTLDMAAFARFMESIQLPPNPNQNLDRTLSRNPPGLSPWDGAVFFSQTPFAGPLKCIDCHVLPAGSTKRFVNFVVTQVFATPQLRNIYKRLGRRQVNGRRASGFGLFHDGSTDDVFALLSKPVFGPLAKQTNNKTKLQNFVLSFDTGTAPAVGYTRSVDSGNVNNSRVQSDVLTLMQQVKARNCELVAKGEMDGVPVGFLYVEASDTFQSDRVALGSMSITQIRAKIAKGLARLSFIGVAPGTGKRLGIDRDLDGILDGDENALPYGAASPSCASGLDFFGNSSPELGNLGFALVTNPGRPNLAGLLLASPKRARVPVFGLTIYVDPASTVTWPWTSGPSGYGINPVPIPASSGLQGLTLYGQTLFPFTCSSSGLGVSNGLKLTVTK
ncbi:MAG: beta-propeller fold lactonase family protein [Planctomycetota bacterium]